MANYIKDLDKFLADLNADASGSENAWQETLERLRRSAIKAGYEGLELEDLMQRAQAHGGKLAQFPGRTARTDV